MDDKYKLVARRIKHYFLSQQEGPLRRSLTKVHLYVMKDCTWRNNAFMSLVSKWQMLPNGIFMPGFESQLSSTSLTTSR